ncbi:Acyl-protein thioesterase 1 [Gracilariopsis chorda]|uniref:Acyl-protein thioesterase 1 n=1 Tax=Gracilariopsis chorda TaxID=448386 RepID=A0A2V3IXF0_9FLOR|nr:Acyl-protein thioesterase 1 [Gracilariopsis chorda]|eukprot:PXF46779.1 Acyl-protein thioesterase 1 [Gracilariopsis chorda]
MPSSPSVIFVLATVFLLSCHNTSAFSVKQLLETYFPCVALDISQPDWTTTYFEPSLVPPSVQNSTLDELSALARDNNISCFQRLPGTTHTLQCSTTGYTFVPAKRPKYALIYIAGLVRKGFEGRTLPIFRRIIQEDPNLTQHVIIHYPLIPFRSITFDSFVSPPLTIGRAWFDVLPPAASTSPSDLQSAEYDRLGLYRAAQKIDFITRAQNCLHGIPPNRVALLGHSLGALALLETVLSTDINPAAAIAVSGVLPRAGDYFRQDTLPYNPSRRSYNLTMVHGTEDKVVPFFSGNASAQIVRPVFTSLGGGFRFHALQGLDHLFKLFEDDQVYSIIREALRNGFMSA